jgi:Protein of unknown function (DUF669)
MSDFNFDASQVAPSSPRGLVPPGEYSMIVTEAELKTTTAGDGRVVATTNEIVDGEYAGQKVWANFNYENKNAQAQEIARRELSALCHAVGVIKLSDPQQLKNRLFRGVVKVEPERTDPKNGKTYKEKNYISTYKTKDGVNAADVAKHYGLVTPAAAAPSAPAPANTASGGAPWTRQASN